MNMRFRLCSVLIAALCFPREGSTVPPGFEELAKGQVVWVDVALYGKPLGLYQVHINPQDVLFMEPSRLITAIGEGYNNAPELKTLLTAVLQAPLSRNGQLACGTQNNPGCNFIKTDSVAVIYDEAQAKVNLFLQPQFVPANDEEEFYQQAADSRRALIHQQNINLVADRDSQAVSVQGNGTLGLTESGHAAVDWLWQQQRYNDRSDHQLVLNNATLRQDFLKRYHLQAGIMDARDIFTSAGGNFSFNQLPITKIRGLRAGTTLAWVNQTSARRGTPVPVFLTRESRVDAYRGSQLLGSFYLSAGSQELNTSTFPPGSYTLTLRIHEDNQLVRTENIPFTASGSENANTLQWFFQTGMMDDSDLNPQQKNDDLDDLVVQGGLRLPLLKTLSLTTGGASLRNGHFLEMALDWFHGFDSGPLDGMLNVRASALYGSEGTRGNVQQVSYNDGFSLSFYRTQMSAEQCDTTPQTLYSQSGCYQNLNLLLSIPLREWSLNLGYSRDKSEGRSQTYTPFQLAGTPSSGGVQPGPVIHSSTESESWQLGLNRYFNWRDININTSLSAFSRSEDRFSARDRGVLLSFSLSLPRYRADSGVNSTSTLGANWQHSQQGQDQLSYNARYSRYSDDSGENELGASLDGVNSDSVTAAISSRAGGRYGTGTLTVSNTWDNPTGRSLPSTSGSYSSSLLLDSTGINWGRWGDGAPAAAVAVGVDLGEESEGARINASVDNGGQAEIPGNGSALFTVPGYRQTTLSIRESGRADAQSSSEILKGSGSRTFYMTPGRVYRKEIEVVSRFTWVGRLFDASQRPLEGGIPLNVQSWTPLGEGRFTLETSRLVKTLYVMRESEFWHCTLEVKSTRDVVRYLGNTRCEPTVLANLPSTEQQQVTLMSAKRQNAVAPSTAKIN